MRSNKIVYLIIFTSIVTFSCKSDNLHEKEKGCISYINNLPTTEIFTERNYQQIRKSFCKIIERKDSAVFIRSRIWYSNNDDSSIIDSSRIESEITEFDTLAYLLELEPYLKTCQTISSRFGVYNIGGIHTDPSFIEFSFTGGRNLLFSKDAIYPEISHRASVKTIETDSPNWILRIVESK